MVVTDLDGTLVEGDRAPSSDTFAHGYVYAHMPHVVASSTRTATTPPHGRPGESRSPAC